MKRVVIGAAAVIFVLIVLGVCTWFLGAPADQPAWVVPSGGPS